MKSNTFMLYFILFVFCKKKKKKELLTFSDVPTSCQVWWATAPVKKA